MLRLNLTFFNAFLLVGLLGVTTSGSFAASSAPKRLHANIEETRTFVLKGNTHPLVTSGTAQDQGQVSSSVAMPRMALHFSLTGAQQTDLNQLLVALQNRQSAQYRKFLTPEEYADRFGLNEADTAKITTWLENNGFSNLQVARSRTWVAFSGTVGQVQNAFHTNIHKYTLNGESYMANANDPELPKALEGVAMGFRGLQNFRLKPHIRLQPHFTSSTSGDTFLVPDDWTTIYDVKPLYSSGLDGSPLSAGPTYCGGSPCSIVVVGQSDIQLPDVAAFRSAAGLPAKAPTVIIPPGDQDPGIVNGDESESDLDVEWSGAIAKNGNILFVTASAVTGNGVEDSITYAVDNNVAPILSTSYGLCEPEETVGDFNTQNSLYQQANAQGMTVITAAGDAGSEDCDTGYPAALGFAVDFPSSSAYVTGIGGTTLTEANQPGVAAGYWASGNNGSNGSAIKYIPEAVWNDSSTANGLAAGGGGVSILIAKPSWQAGSGVPSDGHRDVPDLAFSASNITNPLLICGDGWCTNGFRNSGGFLDTTGGTSAGAPTFAGVLAMLVQQTGGRLGNINANLYAIAQMSGTTAFHDITNGSNAVPCDTGTPNCVNNVTTGYSAGTGYDQASGWGSLDVYNFVQEWPAYIKISASPASLSVQAGATGTTTITVGSGSNFSGTVSFACSVSSSLAGVTCSLPSSTVNTSGTTTLTVTAASSAGAPLWRKFRHIPPVGPALLLLALALLTTMYMLRKQRFVYALGAAALLFAVLGAVSCGGSSSSSGSGGGGTTTTPSETGNITVTATSGAFTNVVVVAVTVP